MCSPGRLKAASAILDSFLVKRLAQGWRATGRGEYVVPTLPPGQGRCCFRRAFAPGIQYSMFADETKLGQGSLDAGPRVWLFFGRRSGKRERAGAGNRGSQRADVRYQKATGGVPVTRQEISCVVTTVGHRNGYHRVAELQSLDGWRPNKAGGLVNGIKAVCCEKRCRSVFLWASRQNATGASAAFSSRFSEANERDFSDLQQSAAFARVPRDAIGQPRGGR